ncbi:hypothetical protein ACFYNZ_00950 [Streptomyces kebangsaanensis]|uniref:Uncharacterized protein n=1 Tax=Streptomyces kebangsaanensis TaxID=864058 RepID=A0ABW6KJL4_9ACTN
MPHCIVRIFEPLLRLIRPALGRHRRPEPQSAGLCVQAPVTHRSRVPAARVVHGEEIGLVRLYLVAYERRERQSRRARRRVVRLAARGIDIDPRLVNGAEVQAW